MKKIFYCIILSLSLSTCQQEKEVKLSKPNIIYILADDLGYGDISALNPEAKINTQYINQMAVNGISFTDAHSNSAVCTPTRYGVLTGRYAWRTWMKKGVTWSWDSLIINPERTTAGSLLQTHGYHTACVGKWHLGLGWQKANTESFDVRKPLTNGPNSVGFDYSFVIPASSPQESKPAEALPNIVLIFTDDQTYTAVQALGNEEIKTPNLDRLVENGTSFTHAYNMGAWHGAVCVASRAMMISGRYVWNAKEFTQEWWDKDSTAMTQTWPQLLAQKGYDTYMTGKWHVAAPADQIFHTTKHIRPGMPRDAWAKEKTFQKIKDLKDSEKDKFAAALPAGYNRPIEGVEDKWSPSDTSFGGFWEGGKHWSEVVKENAQDFIQTANQKDKPFFMYLAFNAPHDPRQAPQSYVDQYPLDNISVPENWLPEYPWKDSIGNGRSLRDEALGPYPRTPYAIKKNLQEYYAIITHLDEQIGDILKALEQSGKMENTYIFFTADHGLAVGQHGLFGKQNMFDHSVRVPLCISGPGIPKGKKINTDIYLQDIMATSLELAQVEKPDYVEFQSFLDLAKGSENQNRNAIYGAYTNTQRMIRKDGFKLIVYPKVPKVLLYNMENDPLEMNDLSEEADYQEKVQNLFSDLLELQQSMNDKLDLSPLYKETILQ